MSEAVALRFAGQSWPRMSANQASERLPGLPRGLLRARREPALVRDAQRGSTEALEELFRRHWRRAHRAAYLVVGDRAPPRTSPRSRSWPRSGRSTASTGGARSARGCTGSPSTGRSTSPARGRCARESALSPAAEPAAPDRDVISDELLAALAGLSARAPGRGRAPLRARVHARRDRRDARAPARHRELAPAPWPRPAAARPSRRASDEPRTGARGGRLRDVRAPGRGGGRGSAPGRSSATPTTSGRRPPRSRGCADSRSPLAGGVAVLAIGLSPAGAKVGELRLGRGRDRRGGREAGAALAARGRRAAGRVRAGAVDRARGRLEAAARRLRGGELVSRAASSSRRRDGRAADRGRARRRPCAGRSPRPAPVHDPRWSPSGVPDRLPLGRRPLGRRRRRHRRATDRPRRRTDGAALAAAIGEAKLAPAEAVDLVAYIDRDGKVQVVERRQRHDRLRDSTDAPAVPARAEADWAIASRRRRAGSNDGGALESRGRRRRDAPVLFATPGRLTGPTWSPDGHWLLVGWPRPISGCSSRQAPGPGDRDRLDLRAVRPRAPPATPRFPRVAGWILPQR